MEKHRPHDLASTGQHDASRRHDHDGDAALLRFTDDLPFSPDWRQVIYIEDGFHKDVNDFLNANYDARGGTMREAGFAFCYLPRLARELQASEFVSYFTPYQDHAVGASPSSSCLMPYLSEGETMPHASLLVYEDSASDNRGYAFSSFEIERLELQPLLDTLLPFLQEKRKQMPDVRYCGTPMLHTPSEDYADECFNEEILDLMDEVREKIARLRQHGVSEMVLRQLLMPRTKLSRLRINERGRIFLPDYGNREIKMTPLVKAVYLLFLSHPGGIKFKCLPDYREELQRIYSFLTGRSSDEAIRKSIDDVTDPCKNSINEKCARIREAFLREFDDSMASHYYITGSRGEAKSISLPASLIENGLHQTLF